MIIENNNNNINNNNITATSFNSNQINNLNLNLKIKKYIPEIYTKEEEIEEKYNEEKYNIDNETNLLKRNPNYFNNQKYIDHNMRSILLDWLMEVSAQLSFKRNTYHLTVVLIDIFLSKVNNIQTNQLQLIGVTCLVIAAKNEV